MKRAVTIAALLAGIAWAVHEGWGWACVGEDGSDE